MLGLMPMTARQLHALPLGEAAISVTEDAAQGTAWLYELTAAATLDDLPAFDATASPETLTSLLDQQFHAHPELPGVIIASDEHLWGLVSREMLLGQLSRPFGIELYLKRPIRLMLEAERQQPLVLPLGSVDIHKMSIIKAASQMKPAKFSTVFS